jgi:hypothetical protein
MRRRIKIVIEEIEVEAILDNSRTAGAIWEALPFKGEVNTWGDEIYFTIPVKVTLESTAMEVVEKGDLGYWPTGTAFCIFFGPTPQSSAGEIRPASAVNVFGKVDSDTSVLKTVSSGSEILVKQADS